MARTLKQIENDLVDSVGMVGNLSPSQVAEWRIWAAIFARSIWAFENILDVFRIDIEALIKKRQPGTLAWYHEKAIEFQGELIGGTFQGDNLLVQNGVLLYDPLAIDRRLITQAAITAGSGILNFKLAKEETATTYQKLTASELLAFAAYLDNIKYPGTNITLISEDADVVTYDLDIIYNPIYNLATVEGAVLAKLDEYRTSLGFDDIVYKKKLVEKILQATGVVSVEVTSLQATGYQTATPAAISVFWKLEAGYFNYNPASTLTFTDATTL